MRTILEATYKNGTLILEESLGTEKEGKKFKIILIEEEKIDLKKERFLQFVEEHTFNLPENYRFNREELYE